MKSAGVGGTRSNASDRKVRTVGDFIPTPLTFERRLRISQSDCRFTSLRAVSPRQLVLNEEPETSMNASEEQVILGVDVSKDGLDIHRHGETTVEHIANERKAIDAFLKRYRGALIAVEATHHYHEVLVKRALALGLIVYLISGYELKHYAASIRRRMRNDAIDAQLLSRFLAHERDSLVPYEPKSPQLAKMWQLLKRRALLVKQQHQFKQSLSDIPELSAIKRTLTAEYKRALARIDRTLKALSETLHWQADLKRLTAVKGIGPLTRYELLTAYHSGRFVHRDAFVAYLGLDVRTKDSGKHKGKRKLTKHGDGEYRRVLFCAAKAAARTQGYFKARYQALLARGLASTAAYVVIARQLARLAFVLLRRQLTFDPSRLAIH